MSWIAQGPRPPLEEIARAQLLARIEGPLPPGSLRRVPLLVGACAHETKVAIAGSRVEHGLDLAKEDVVVAE